MNAKLTALKTSKLIKRIMGDWCYSNDDLDCHYGIDIRTYKVHNVFWMYSLSEKSYCIEFLIFANESDACKYFFLRYIEDYLLHESHRLEKNKFDSKKEKDIFFNVKKKYESFLLLKDSYRSYAIFDSSKINYHWKWVNKKENLLTIINIYKLIKRKTKGKCNISFSSIFEKRSIKTKYIYQNEEVFYEYGKFCLWILWDKKNICSEYKIFGSENLACKYFYVRYMKKYLLENDKENREEYERLCRLEDVYASKALFSDNLSRRRLETKVY